MDDAEHMRRAMALAGHRPHEPPRPTPGWARVVVRDRPPPATTRTSFEGATAPPGGPHAEASALAAAGEHGSRRHPLRHAGAVCPPRADAALHRRHRRGGGGPGRRRHRGSRPAGGRARRRRPAGGRRRGRGGGRRRPRWPSSWRPTSSTGRPASPGSCSRWRPASTGAPPRPTAPAGGSPGEAARRDVAPPAGALRRRARRGGHRAGRRSRADGPARATARDRAAAARRAGHGARRGAGPPGPRALGRAGRGARRAGRRGVLQLLVEGGATVAHDFHAAGLVDRYVLYLAPAFFGGDDGRPLFAGPGAGTIGDVWRGQTGVGRTTGGGPSSGGGRLMGFSSVARGHRRHRPARHGRRRRRRGPGERGRPRHGGRGGHAREHRLLPGPHLRA